MPKLTEEHQQQQRTTILTAARHCFARNGFHATSIDDIARESEMSLSTIYRHFHGKDDIIYASTEERFDSLIATLDQSMTRRPLPAPSLVFTTVVQNLVREFGGSDDFREAARLVLNAWTEAGRNLRVGEHAGSVHEELRTTLATIMRTYQKAGLLRPGLNADTAADTVWMLSLGLFAREALIGDHAIERTARIVDEILLADIPTYFSL